MARLGGTASIELDAPLDAVYAVLEDVPDAPNWQDALERIEVVERDAKDRAVLTLVTADAKVRKITTTVRFSYEEGHAVRWEQVKGDVKSLNGAWELSDLGGGRTKVDYVLEIDPGRVLGLLIRGPVEGVLRNILIAGRPAELAARVAQELQ
jgi:uncharacterized membrane protein